MAKRPRLQGGPVWRESSWAFDVGCNLTGHNNAELGLILPFHAGRDRTLATETVRLWRIGRRDAPFWAFLGLWRLLRAQNHTPAALRETLGFEFAE